MTKCQAVQNREPQLHFDPHRARLGASDDPCGSRAALAGADEPHAQRHGWWIEGWNEGVTGWAISDHDDEIHEGNSLYERLEQVILPLYYGQPAGWRRIMRSTIAINGSYFNTQRMLKQYVLKAYYPELRPASTPVLERVLAY